MVHSGTNNTFSMPVMLSFWGTEENREAVTRLLIRRGFKLDKNVNSGTGEVSKDAHLFNLTWILMERFVIIMCVCVCVPFRDL